MDLYVDPVATTSRAVLALCEAERLAVNVRNVDLMKGEQHRAPLAELNPNCLVPVLADGDFVLTEASAILRYLARRSGSPLYPSAVRDQARVDESMAWFESNFYRDFGFLYVYPHFIPHHRLPDDAAARISIERALEESHRWLKVLDGHFLRHGEQYLLGEKLTIADFFGASILSVGELVGFRPSGYPNVERWQRAMTAEASWSKVNGPFRRLVDALAKPAAAQGEPRAALA